MDEFKTFMTLSEALLGVNPLSKIEPRSLGDTIAKDYFRRLREQFPADLVALLTLFDSKAGSPDPLKALTDDAAFKDGIASVAKQVVHAWMLSQYRVESPGKTGDAAPAFDTGFFEKGIVWGLIQAHPIGFSHRSHGYWTEKPE